MKDGEAGMVIDLFKIVRQSQTIVTPGPRIVQPKKQNLKQLQMMFKSSLPTPRRHPAR
jgi:hypothetical protein